MPRSLAATVQDPIELLEQAEVLRKRAEQSFGEYALEAGRLLLAAKKQIPHGSWAQHIADHTGFSQRTAEVYMRARKRYDGLPSQEKQAVLDQPFSRSLLVLAQAPRQSLILDTPIALPPPREVREVRTETQTRPFTNGSTVKETDREASQLVDDAIDYHPPLDELINMASGPGETFDFDVSQDITPEYARAEDVPDLQAQLAEATNEYRDALAEIEKLESEKRDLLQANQDLQTQVVEARSQPAAGQPTRGWDYIQNLYQYLKADEAQRTPETLARRALQQSGGRSVVAFLEQFFAATRVQMNEQEHSAAPVA